MLASALTLAKTFRKFLRYHFGARTEFTIENLPERFSLLAGRKKYLT